MYLQFQELVDYHQNMSKDGGRNGVLIYPRKIVAWSNDEIRKALGSTIRNYDEAKHKKTLDYVMSK